MGKKITLTESDLKKMINESVKKIVTEMYMNEFGGEGEDLAMKAKQIFDGLHTSDFEIDPDQDKECVDPPYGYEVGVVAETQDENGGMWTFYTGGYATRTGDDDYELEDIGDTTVEFIAPDETTGTF